MSHAIRDPYLHLISKITLFLFVCIQFISLLLSEESLAVSSDEAVSDTKQATSP